MIKVGDIVERKDGNFYQHKLQNEVTSISDCGDYLRVNGRIMGAKIKQFKVVDTSKHHKHHDLIIAWAKGAEIEVKNPDSKEWFSVMDPMWVKHCKYRVKPSEPTELEKLKAEHEAMGKTISKLEEQANGF